VPKAATPTRLLDKAENDEEVAFLCPIKKRLKSNTAVRPDSPQAIKGVT